MTSRSDELRQRHRTIVRWSLAFAVAIHVALFLLWPSITRDSVSSGGLEITQVQEHDGPRTRIDVRFGPPEITGREGLVTRQPRDRVLEAQR